MRNLMTIISIMSFMLLTACQSNADLQRQKNLLEQTNRTYAVTEMPATQIQPNAYEFCGNEKFPCPTQTATDEQPTEKQPNETIQPTAAKASS